MNPPAVGAAEAGKLVAVVLVNWNNSTDTRQCISSLQASSYSNWLVVVVDNGSSDDSITVLQPLCSSRIELIENATNEGFACGSNRGIRRALERQADYVLLLNSDTVVGPEAIAGLIATLESDPGMGAVGGVLCDMCEPHQVQEWGGGWINLRTGRIGYYAEEPRSDSPIDYLCGGSLLARAQALRMVGGFDPGYFMYWEDVDLGLRMRSAGWRLGVAREVRIRHRRGATTGYLLRDYYAGAGSVRTLRKHARFPRSTILLALTLRIGAKLARGQFRRAEVMLRGARAGWRNFAAAQPYGPVAIPWGLFRRPAAS